MIKSNSLIIITGGNGFVGRYLIAELKKQRQNVLSWDLPEIDLMQEQTYLKDLKELKPDWIVHLAAMSAVGSSFDQEELVYKVNTEASQSLFKNIKKVSPNTKVLAVSSADIYGLAMADFGDTPVSELSLEKAKPRNPYAKSKLEMEKIIVDNFNDFIIRVRPFPHIGPGQGLGFVTADFTSQIVAIEKKEQEPVIRVGNLEAKRDFTDVRDVVRAYVLLLTHGEIGDVYHVASGKAVSIQEILDRLLIISKSDARIEQDESRMRLSDIPVSVGDASKLYERTGWEPEIKLEKTLKDILSWWREKK